QAAGRAPGRGPGPGSGAGRSRPAPARRPGPRADGRIPRPRVADRCERPAPRRRRAGATRALEGGGGATGAGWGSGPLACGRRLPVDPVGRLHEESVVRVQVEEVAEVPAHRSRPLRACLVEPTLCPYDEQRRSGAVLPPQYSSRVEHLLVDPVGGSRIGLVAI